MKKRAGILFIFVFAIFAIIFFASGVRADTCPVAVQGGTSAGCHFFDELPFPEHTSLDTRFNCTGIDRNCYVCNSGYVWDSVSGNCFLPGGGTTITCGVNEAVTYNGCSGYYYNYSEPTSGQCLPSFNSTPLHDCILNSSSQYLCEHDPDQCYWVQNYASYLCNGFDESTCYSTPGCVVALTCSCPVGYSYQTNGTITSECSGNFSFSGWRCEYNIPPGIKSAPVCYGLTNTTTPVCESVEYCQWHELFGTGNCQLYQYPDCPTGCTITQTQQEFCLPNSPGICSDTDAPSINPSFNYINYTKQGTVSGAITGVNGTDSCSGNVLTEHYCDTLTNVGLTTTFDCMTLGSEFICSNGACVNTTSSITCNDPDGGLDYTVQTNVTTSDGGSGEDFCFQSSNWGVPTSTGDMLMEYYCSPGNSIASSSYACPTGCSNGACNAPTVTCNDPDGGLNYTAQTTVTTSDGGNGTDFCFQSSNWGTPTPTGDMLMEYYCSGNSIASSNYSCPAGCSAGVCLAPTTFWTDYTGQNPISSFTLAQYSNRPIRALVTGMISDGSPFQLTTTSGISTPSSVSATQSGNNTLSEVFNVTAGSVPGENNATYLVQGTSSMDPLNVTVVNNPNPNCGDGIVEPPEECDGTNLTGKTCITEGFTGGTLLCYSPGGPNACTFDTSQCTLPICNNNGICDVGETPGNCPDCTGPVTGCQIQGINLCGDYAGINSTNPSPEYACNADLCNVAPNTPPPAGPGQVDRCQWNATDSTCNKFIPITVNGKEVGSCVSKENPRTDDCSDGFLSYSWNSTWTWAQNNTGLIPHIAENCSEFGPGYVYNEEGNGLCHYDPNGDFAKCVPTGSATIACPAQVELSFFDWRNVVAAVLIIFVLYVLLMKDKKRKIKKSSKKSKKK